MNTNIQDVKPPTQEEIATYAYYLWEGDGRPQGRDMEYWLQAKAHLIADRQYQAGAASRESRQAARPSLDVKKVEASINDALPADKVSRKKNGQMSRRQSLLV